MNQLARWLWVPALVVGLVGVCGLVDLGEADWLGVQLMLGPYALAVGYVAWAGRRKLTAGLLGLGAIMLMAASSRNDALNRQTEGFEWRFNNALSGMMHVGFNYVVLFFMGVLALGLIPWPNPLDEET